MRVRGQLLIILGGGAIMPILLQYNPNTRPSHCLVIHSTKFENCVHSNFAPLLSHTLKKGYRNSAPGVLLLQAR